MKAEDRFISVLEELNISAYTLEKRFNLKGAQAKISHYKNKRANTISNDIIVGFCQQNPNVNMRWIMTGIGQPFISNNDNEEETTNNYNHYLNKLLNHISYSVEEFATEIGCDIKELLPILNNENTISVPIAKKIKKAFPEISYSWIIDGSGDMILTEQTNGTNTEDALNKYYTKLLPTSAVGGSLVGLQADGVFDYQCEKVVSPIPDIDFAMQVYGDSMSPVYPNGSRVFIKKVNPDVFIEYNRIYVLDTSNGVIIKKVMPSDKEGHIKCVSLNEEYLPFEVHMNEIHGWYKVLGCLTLSI